MLNLVNTMNDMIDQPAIFAKGVKKVAREVGTKKLGMFKAATKRSRRWGSFMREYKLTTPYSLGLSVGNSTTQVFAQIAVAVMDGDFTRFNTVEASGELDPLKTQISQMVFNLRDSPPSFHGSA
jgi:osomolarity two-component system sensor histidine kinase NIK1